MPSDKAITKRSLVKLGVARDEVELALWRDVLEQDGVPCVVKNIDTLATSYYLPPLPYSLEVHVLARDESRARWLLGLKDEP